MGPALAQGRDAAPHVAGPAFDDGQIGQGEPLDAQHRGGGPQVQLTGHGHHACGERTVGVRHHQRLEQSVGGHAERPGDLDAEPLAAGVEGHVEGVQPVRDPGGLECGDGRRGRPVPGAAILLALAHGGLRRSRPARARCA